MTTPTQTAHTRLVKLLYRRIIREQLNWCIGRKFWIREARKTRSEFDRNSKLTDPGQVNSAIQCAQQWLKDHQHPEPYTNIHVRGGSSYQRNVAPPMSVIETDWSTAFQDPNKPAEHH